jgi:hypothetical protein
MDGACSTCPLGLAPCWAVTSGSPRICGHVRGELAALARGEAPPTTYRELVRARSDPAYAAPPAPPPEATPPPPQPTVGLPACPDRGPRVDDAGCLTFKCSRHIRIVSGCECGRCVAAGFAYVG